MAKGTITFDLDQPPEQVFDYIADIRNEAKWSKDIRGVAMISDGPVGEGTQFEVDYKIFGRVRLALRDYRRPSHVVIDGDGPRVGMHFDMDVQPQGSGSLVTFFLEMRPRGALLPMAPLLPLMLPRELAKRPEQFRAALAA